MPLGDRRPKVVITDIDFPTWDLELEALAEIDAEVSVVQCHTEDEVIEACADADGMLIQYAPITERSSSKLDRCQVVSRYGIGVDTIDIAACTQAGVWVCNAGDYCRTEVAEHAMALLLACSRRVVVLDRSTHRGEWNAVGVGGQIRSLPGRVLGLIGFGTIGREVAVRREVVRDAHHHGRSGDHSGVRGVARRRAGVAGRSARPGRLHLAARPAHPPDPTHDEQHDFRQDEADWPT